MGWMHNGVCHETAAQYIEAFASFYPYVTDQYVATISPPTLNESTGMLFTTYMLKGVVGVTNYSKPLTLSVQPCTPSTASTFMGVEWNEGAVIGSVFLVLWALGFNGGLKR